MSQRVRPPQSNATKATQDVTVRLSWPWFSELSPYLHTNLLFGDPTVPDQRINRESLAYDVRYLKLPFLQSLPEAEQVPALIRKELCLIFFEKTAQGLRGLETYQTRWHRDISMVTLDKRYRDISPTYTSQFLNKELMVYFEPISVGGCYSRQIACYIYRAWLRLFNGRPPFQRDSYFAKAAQIAGNGNGPQDLHQLSILHRRLCQQISRHLDDKVDFYSHRSSKSSNILKPPFFEPIPSRNIQSWRENGYAIRHLFRALYMVVDSQALVEPAEPGPAEPHNDHYDWFRYREDAAERDLERCTVLLVRTGDEAHLSSPISFLPLFEGGLALPVNRQDYSGEVPSRRGQRQLGEDFDEAVVRVKLKAAVRFIWELLQKEASLEEVRQVYDGLREEQETFCQAWVGRVMAHSEKVGIDKNGYTWLAVRRALARLNNEAFEEDQVHPCWENLRRWL